MPELILYHFPGACSQVTVCALEQTGLPYELRLVNLAAGEQQSPAYRALSPLGKAPLLLVDGRPLSENPALIVYLDAVAPEAGLFPQAHSPLDVADRVSGLGFCSATLHPMVRGIANPARLTTGDVEGVRERATELARKAFGHAEKRIQNSGWWLGDWSIIDVYLRWAFATATSKGFDSRAYPALEALTERLEAKPAFKKMLEIEAKSRKSLGLGG